MTTEAFEKADELLRKGKYPQAIELLRALLGAQPENGELRAKVAEAYRLSGNLERAFHHFNRGAQVFQRAGDLPGACRMLKAANSVSPNEPDILYRMAECLKLLDSQIELDLVLKQLITVARGVGDRRRLWALEQLCSRYPKDIELAVQHASALGETGRIDDAVTAWKRVSAHLEVLGIDFVPMLKKAAEIAAERADVGVDLAEVLLIARHPRDALAVLVPFYEKFPDDIGVLGALVRALEQLGAIDKVIPARIELIKTRVKRGHRELAFQEVSRLMEVAPDDPLALEVSAHTFGAFGFRGDASALWRRLAKLHERLGRVAERNRAILMLLKINPDDPEALALGARWLSEAGHEREASALRLRLNEIVQVQDQAGSLPAVEPGDFQTDTDVPALSTAADVVVSDDYSLSDVFAAEYPSDVFAPDDFSSPDEEPLPIAMNPYAQDLDVELPTRIAEPLAEMRPSAEYALPEERMSEAEETTSRMEMASELARLRRSFEEDEATKLDLVKDDDPTLPPPDDFDEFTSKTRSRLISDLLHESGQNEDL